MKAINCDTKEFTYFNSMTAVEKFLQINKCIVKKVCDGCKYYKSGTSIKGPMSQLIHALGPVQTSSFCRAELNSGMKFDKSTAEARRLNQTFELSSALS